jgi:hypothetical protein
MFSIKPVNIQISSTLPPPPPPPGQKSPVLMCVKLGIVCAVCRLTEDLKDRCYTLQLLTETRVPMIFFLHSLKRKFSICSHGCVFLNPDPVQTNLLMSELPAFQNMTFLYFCLPGSWINRDPLHPQDYSHDYCPRPSWSGNYIESSLKHSYH